MTVDAGNAEVVDVVEPEVESGVVVPDVEPEESPVVEPEEPVVGSVGASQPSGTVSVTVDAVGTGGSVVLVVVDGVTDVVSDVEVGVHDCTASPNDRSVPCVPVMGGGWTPGRVTGGGFLTGGVGGPGGGVGLGACWSGTGVTVDVTGAVTVATTPSTASPSDAVGSGAGTGAVTALTIGCKSGNGMPCGAVRPSTVLWANSTPSWVTPHAAAPMPTTPATAAAPTRLARERRSLRALTGKAAAVIAG